MNGHTLAQPQGALDSDTFVSHPDHGDQSSGRRNLLSIVLAIELMLALAVAGYWVHTRTDEVQPATATHATQQTASSRAQTTAPTADAAPLVPRSQVPVAVLNAGASQGTAADGGTHAQQLGYPVTTVGNADGSLEESIVMYAPGNDALAQRVARDLKISAVGPLDGIRRGDLSGARIAVIYGTNTPSTNG